jgi:DnaJ-class molecular chaperone
MANRNPSVDWGKDKCKSCGGTGQAIAAQDTRPAALPPATPDWPDCPDCGGTGKAKQSIPIDELNASNDD